MKTNQLSSEALLEPAKSLSPSKIKYNFIPGDIVYVLYDPERHNGFDYPSIGSPNEIDCKVLTVTQEDGIDVLYVISGYGNQFRLRAKFAVPANELYKFTKNAQVTAKKNNELCDVGAIFVKRGGYYSNESYGIYIHEDRMDELIQAGVF